MSSVTLDGEFYCVKISPGDAWKSDYALVKSLPGRIYSMDERVWRVPATPYSLKVLESAGFELSPEIVGLQEVRRAASIELSTDDRLSGLREYQKEGVAFISDVAGGVGIIGDQMGVGKTIQAIGYFIVHPELRPVVVVCPSSVKHGWKREIVKWTGDRVEILEGVAPYPTRKARWYIINYDILGKVSEWRVRKGKRVGIKSVEGWVHELLKKTPKGLVIDEVQNISNRSTIRSFCVRFLAKNIKKPIIALSGTAIRDHPAQFFTILNLLRPKRFPSEWKFWHRYCGPTYNGFGWEYKGASNLSELHNLTKDIMIRRLKRDVLPELPPKQYSIVPMDVVGAYDTSDLKTFLINSNTLRQEAYVIKRKAVIQWIKDYLESGQKLVIMAYHHKTIDDLCETFKGICVKIDGRDGSANRERARQKFMEDENCTLFIGQLQAAGVGLDGLQVAASLAFVEFSFVPADHLQAEDRIHRIGQESDSVNVYYLVGRDSVEEDIVETLIQKYGALSQILDGECQEEWIGSASDSVRTDVGSVKQEVLRRHYERERRRNS